MMTGEKRCFAWIRIRWRCKNELIFLPQLQILHTHIIMMLYFLYTSRILDLSLLKN